MDRRIEEGLEEHLRGSLDPRERAEFDRALEASNAETRRAVDMMRRQSNVIRDSLRAREDVEPAAGFYARVLARIEEQKANGSIWGLFLEPSFFRRLALATATLLLLLGITVFSGEPEEQITPVEAMAVQSEPLPVATMVSDPQAGRDAILVDLTTYRE